jgi:hypothetical protein
MTVNNSVWADTQTPANAQWSRTSGIDTSIPTYDAIISYGEAAEFYDGYDATTITEDDVHFSAYTEVQIPTGASFTETAIANSAFTDADTNLLASSWLDIT